MLISSEGAMNDFYDTPFAAGHLHVFLGATHGRNERKTWAVIALCSVMMITEIAGGALFGSLALVADGLHMSTHAGAMLIAALAYTYARKHAHDPRFVFGTGKLGDLAGFSSALILALVALLIAYEAVTRLLFPQPIRFAEAIPIAALGLMVNVTSAWLLRDDGHHAHEHDHEQHGVDGRDHNIRAAYIHVLADAVVSVLAIIGLLLARKFGWLWMDPLAGTGGALVISNWAYGLLRATGANLVDIRDDDVLSDKIKAAVATAGDRLADLHVWRLGPGHCGVLVSVITLQPQRSPMFYHELLRQIQGLSHLTVEVNPQSARNKPDCALRV
jgi:cation diffusion facilitator family transporter